MSLLLFGSASSGGGSVPTFHSLTSGGTTTDATSYLTEIVAPTANRLVLISINCYMATGSVQPPQPTVTGNGITYALVQAQDVDTLGTDRSTMWVFRGMNSAPTAGQVTIDFGATTVGAISWNVSQSSASVDTSGTNGSGAIVQAVGATSATTVTASPTVTFSPAMTAGNSAYFACGTQTAQVQTPRSGWVELGDVATVAICGLETQYINGTDTDGSSTWTTAARAASILVEVKGGVTSPNGYIAGHASSATGSVTTLPGVTHTTPILDDIEILAHASDQAQTLAIDSDFTQLLNLVDGNLRAYLGWNVSDGTETGDVSISSTPTANRQVGALATFRGYTGIAGTASLAETGTDTAHTSPTYTPINTGSLVGFVYLERTSSSTVAPVTPPGGLTKAVEFGTSGSGGTYVQIAYKDSGVVAGVDESPGDWTSLVAAGSVYVFAFELTPAATGVTGALDGTLPAITATLAGAARASGTLAGNLPSLTGSLSGSVRTSGSLTGTLPAITGSFTGAVGGVSGSVDGTLPALTGSVTGAIRASATMAGNLPVLSGSLAGASRVSGSADGSLPSITGSLTAAVRVAGAANGTLPAVTASLSGSIKAGATLSATLPALTGDLAGTIRLSGSLTSSLPGLTAALTGDVSTPGTPVTGALAGSLPALQSGITGALAVSGTISGTLPALTATITAALRATGSLTGVLPDLIASLTGNAGPGDPYTPLVDPVMTLRPNLADSTPRANPASATARPSSTAASVRPNPAEAMP